MSFSIAESEGKKPDIFITVPMFFSVMVSTLGNQQLIFSGFINQAMLLIDAARPVSFPVVSQRFRVSDTFEGVSAGFQDEAIDSLQYPDIGFLPVDVILPCLLSP